RGLREQRSPTGAPGSGRPRARAATNVAAATDPVSLPAPPCPAPPATPAKADRRRGRRLLLVLFALACALAVAAAVVTAVLITQRSRHAAAHSLRATVFRLHPGQCFNSLPNGIAGAHAIPCAQPHDAEIYGDFRVAGRNWPGTAALGEQARQGCQSRLSGYLNPQLDTT